MDRDRRQEAGRNLLIEAGVVDEQKIQSILASPPKKEPEAAAAVPNVLLAGRDPLPNRAAAAVQPIDPDFGGLLGIMWRQVEDIQRHREDIPVPDPLLAVRDPLPNRAAAAVHPIHPDLGGLMGILRRQVEDIQRQREDMQRQLEVFQGQGEIRAQD